MMLNILVGIIILVFAFLGLREGLAKALGSIILVFLAIFLATSTLGFLARSNASFSDPNYFGSIIIFLLVWGLSFGILDLLLAVLFQKAIRIVILGPVDMIGGVVVGGAKAMLICGMVLQLLVYFPISANSKQQIKDAPISRLSIGLYQWVYPFARQFAPKVDAMMNKNIIDKIVEKEKVKPNAEDVKKVAPGDLMDKVIKVDKLNKQQQERIKSLLEKKQILPDAPRQES